MQVKEDLIENLLPHHLQLFYFLYKKISRPREEWNFLALLAALGVKEALQSLDSSADITVKWPNDLLIKERKFAGLLCQATEYGVIIGIGINISMRSDELPVETATSLFLENFTELDRNTIVKKILQNFEEKFSLWNLQGSAPFIHAYERACSSLHRQIQIVLPNHAPMDAIAIGVTSLGELKLDVGTLVNSADVIHLR